MFFSAWPGSEVPLSTDQQRRRYINCDWMIA